MNEKYLLSLMGTMGISGFESTVSKHFIDYVSPNCKSTEIDAFGNGYAFLNAKETDGRCLMIEAHSDEIGFQVIHISDNGYLYVRRNGSIDEQCLPGTQLWIETNDGNRIPGVIGKKPIHLMAPDERKRVLDIGQVWVDTGLSKEKLSKIVSVGNCVSFANNLLYLGDNKISGRALDNKVGVFILCEIMRNLADFDNIQYQIVGVATAQEEVGSRGALIAAHRVNPDIALTIDMDFATDTPDTSVTKYGDIRLGNGPIIPLNADIDKTIYSAMTRIARKYNIPHQISARPHATGGTNSSRIQLVNDGIRTISVGIPCRYMHTPVEMCDLDDIQNAIRLITNFCVDTP